MRLALGFVPVIGMRMDAERLPAEYTRLTGASKPGTRRWYVLTVGLVNARIAGRVLEDAADVPARDVGQTAVARLVVEQRLAVVPERLVGVHARAVVAHERLRHEASPSCPTASAVFLTMYLNFRMSSAARHHRVEACS